jgi:hypothetical protein
MKTYTAELESISTYSSSRFHGVEKKDRETADEYEKRTWRDKLTTDKDGSVLIKASAFKFALDTAAKQLGKQVPGKGKRTYTAIFKAGVLVPDDVQIGVKKEAVEGVWVHVNADGVRGSGKRVMRCFPTVPSWRGKCTIIVLDDAITADILKEHADRAGAFVGVGQYRPENGGTNGRFKVLSIK